jgi:hypothetical protein
LLASALHSPALPWRPLPLGAEDELAELLEVFESLEPLFPWPWP